MAGTTVATWVKVKTKTGLTSRPISHKYEGGANYEKGQIITQSEYEAIKGKRGGSISDLKSKRESDLEIARKMGRGEILTPSEAAIAQKRLNSATDRIVVFLDKNRDNLELRREMKKIFKPSPPPLRRIK